MHDFLKELDEVLTQTVRSKSHIGLPINDLSTIILIEDKSVENLQIMFPDKNIQHVRLCVGLPSWRFIFFVNINDIEYIRCIDGIEYRN